MSFDEWLTTIPIHQTPEGARLDLRLYVYPDGHGNLCVEDQQGRSVTNPQPVNNPAEAREVLEKLWERAMNLKAAATTLVPAPGRTIAERLADVIGIASDLPEDMAAQHDHYIHGAPKS
jgi:hypothetical protein